MNWGRADYLTGSRFNLLPEAGRTVRNAVGVAAAVRVAASGPVTMAGGLLAPEKSGRFHAAPDFRLTASGGFSFF